MTSATASIWQPLGGGTVSTATTPRGWVTSQATTSGTTVLWTTQIDELARWTAPQRGLYSDMYTQAYHEHQQRLYQGYERQLRAPRRELPAAPAILRGRPRPLIDDAAKLRAQALLLEHLTPEQQRTLAAHKWFIVEGGRSKTRYRIQAERGLAGNVDVLLDDIVTHRLCAHCAPSAIPMGDQLLAQKVMLELAEDEFLRIANRHGA